MKKIKGKFKVSQASRQLLSEQLEAKVPTEPCVPLLQCARLFVLSALCV